VCGIFGFVSEKNRSADTVVDGLRYLEYRGYDSWGVAIAHAGSVEHEKAVGPIDRAHTRLQSAPAALGHTRWATHGGVTVANAHPHVDCGGRFALIHNGIVENYHELGGRLRRAHRFASQTDTEVLVHLLEEALETEPDLLQALLCVFRQVQGLSAVAVLDARTNRIAAAKNGSPLALGWGEGAAYLASDPLALLDHTRNITFLEDGEAALLAAGGISVHDIRSGAALQPDIRRVEWDTQRAGLDGYAHFMAKEIHEQPRVLREIAQTKWEDAQALATLIGEARDVYLIGCGTAHHAAQSGRYALAQIAGRSTTAAVASEMDLILPLIDGDSLVVALSQSGETIDVLEAVKAARSQGARVAALVNAEGSALDRFADMSIHLGCGPERCVLATKSYTAKLAILHLTARALSGDVGRGAAEIREAAYRVEDLLGRERVDGSIRNVARRVSDEQHMFVLGRGRSYPLALEAALKIKEVSYMHAEGFAAGELKHGVIALVSPGTPCIMLSSDEGYRRETLAAAAEVGARGAYVVGLSPEPASEFAVTLPIGDPASAPFEIAASTQLLAYEIALIRGCDPDRPRNLAKSVTVK
jgi:glucosamine--fructose-6-phosphate aminotransferase (isomerizing)